MTQIYLENIQFYNAKALSLKKAQNRMSLLRLFIFIISAIILISLFSQHLFFPFVVVLLLSSIGFTLAFKRFNKITYQRKHTLFLKRINETEILRANCDLKDLDTGEQFINYNHPYTSDLDIFGQHSIFQLLNRTTTESGLNLLAEWLSEPASNDEIKERQKAVIELSEKIEWRQDFQASGMHFKNKKSDFKTLMNWVNSPNVLFKNRVVFTLAGICFSIMILLGLYAFTIELVPVERYIHIALLSTVLIVNYFILRKVKPAVESLVETAQTNLDTCRGYETLIRHIEQERFTAERLLQLKSILSKSNYSAYKEIKKLSQLLDFSQQRPIKKIPIGGNFLYPLLNSLFLIDVYLVIGIEKWKSKNKAFLASWSEVVSEFEVINSFAGFTYANPDYTFAELTDKKHLVHFKSLGHPLIHSGKRVCNDFDSEGQGDIVMITGSNMGGKSTFLRSVGVNLVLALAGAPCCASYGQVFNLRLFTSMRTQDNLKNGISSFYAELDRIEKLLKLIDSRENVFFLLDEMFKGTNSEDRHKGGFSLINQLSKLKSSGIIATHDIELARLCENKNLVSNFSFNSEIKGNSMVFSYKLHKAICHDFNASALMQRSGIQILSDTSNS